MCVQHDAAGCRLFVLQQEMETPTGNPIQLFRLLKLPEMSLPKKSLSDNIDINTSAVLQGIETLNEVGNRIFDEIVKIASGQLTKRKFSVTKNSASTESV
jgi:altronate dehydratase large subunit